MVFAAAVRADAGVTLERVERASVLDAGVVAGDVERRSNVRAPLSASFQLRDGAQRRGHADDERAGAAHARGPRQIAGEDDVGAEAARGEVPDEPLRDDFHVVRPAG